jgi:Cu+-exporting ATPase
MISGDGIRTLEAIAEKTGIEQVRAEIPVNGWAAELERIRDTGHRLAIVGRPPSKDRVSMREDLVIEVGRSGPEDHGSDAGVLCVGQNLELVVEVLDIAKMSRKTILVATFAALLMQVFAAGIALSGLVSPIEVGGLINVVAGSLWFLRPRMMEPSSRGL